MPTCGAKYSVLVRFAPSLGERVVLRRVVSAAAVPFEDSHGGEALERPRTQAAALLDALPELLGGHAALAHGELHGGDLVAVEAIHYVLAYGRLQRVELPQHARRDAVLERQLHRGIFVILS